LAKDVEPYADWSREVNNKERCLPLTGRQPGEYILEMLYLYLKPKIGLKL
jgi:hypothetical protein